MVETAKENDPFLQWLAIVNLIFPIFMEVVFLVLKLSMIPYLVLAVALASAITILGCNVMIYIKHAKQTWQRCLTVTIALLNVLTLMLVSSLGFVTGLFHLPFVVGSLFELLF